MHLKEGYRLHNGKYQLLNVIGEGGFSLTYKGLWNTEILGKLGKIPTQAPVCIKEYFFKDYCLRNAKTNFVESNSQNGKIIFDKYKEKIIKEARILSEIHHPNVVKVLEVFKQNNTVYTVMEFIAGDSLKQELEKSGVFQEEKLLPLIFQIGQALQYIHEKNILHLDIKPSNILMDGKQTPKLIDFGISKRYDAQDQQETSTSILAASKGYASIEQYDSEGMQVFSPCPDVYSLGATMYFLLTGQVPTESILRSTKGLQSPRELNPEVSENTEKVILKAMELHANDRYQSVIEMITELGFNPETDKISPLSPADQDEEKTELLSSVKQSIERPFDVDDETEVYTAKQKGELNRKRRKRIYGLLAGIIIVMTILGFIILNTDTFLNKNKLPLYSENALNYKKHFDTGVQQYSNSNFSQAKAEMLIALSYMQTDEAKKYVAKIDSLMALLQIPEDNVNSSDSVIVPSTDNEQKTNEENRTETINPEQEFYDQAFKSGLALFKAENFEAAIAAFEKASSHKQTTEANNYISQCNSKLEEKSIAKRKLQYEDISNFGTFVVVRKLDSNGVWLYGAIDNKGQEKIPCKYLKVETIGDNKAFLRKDYLYDVYAPSKEAPIYKEIENYLNP